MNNKVTITYGTAISVDPDPVTAEKSKNNKKLDFFLNPDTGAEDKTVTIEGTNNASVWLSGTGKKNQGGGKISISIENVANSKKDKFYRYKVSVNGIKLDPRVKVQN
jgi:hypothetical protein